MSDLPTDRQITVLHYNSIEEVYEAELKDRINAMAKAGAANNIFPGLIQAEEITIVRRICNAMLSTVRVRGLKTAMGYVRQAVLHVLNAESLPDIAVETVAWRIFDQAKMAFIMTITEAHHNIKREAFQTFADHIDAIIKALEDSKDTVKRLTDPDILKKFVSQPNKVMKTTQTNSKLNAKRNEQVAAGIRSLRDSSIEEPVASSSIQPYGNTSSDIYDWFWFCGLDGNKA